MTELVQEVTAEEVAQHYKAAMDSVNLLNAGKPEDMTDENWTDCKKRNIDHLNIMLAKDFWTTEDLTPFKNAVKL